MGITASQFVQGKDLPDFRTFLKNPVSSPLTITGTNPTLNFDDTTAGDDNYSISADADVLRIQNTDNNATVLRLVDGAGEDFDLNVDSDILNIINTTGPITYIRFRGAANDDIQVDRPIVFNSTVTLPEDINLSGASPSITFTDTGGDDFSITADANLLTFLNITQSDKVDLGSNPVLNITAAGSSDAFLRCTVDNQTSSGIATIQIVDNNNGTTNFVARNSGEVRLAAGYPTNLSDVPSKTITVGGQYDQTLTQTGNVGGGIDPLHTYSIAANVLANDGDSLDFIGGGTVLAAGNNKQIFFYIAGTAVFGTGTFDPVADSEWSLNVTVTRIDGDSVIASGRYLDTDGSVRAIGNSTQLNGLTFTGSITMEWRAEDSDGVNNRIVQNFSVVRKYARAQ